MTEQTLRAPRRPPAGAREWTSLHIHLDRPRDAVDRYLVDQLTPALHDLDIRPWFFIRYAEGGHHLRLRVPVLETVTLAELIALLDSTLGGTESVRSAQYEPEIVRYGGAAAIEVAEDVFAASSRLAVQLLGRFPSPERRLALGVELTLATASALDLRPDVMVRWLRINAFSWRWHPNSGVAPAAGLLDAAVGAVPARRAPVLATWQALESGDRGRTSPAGSWLATVRRAREALETDGPLPWLGVWGSQLHMLCNRLGLLPDEERWIAWFVSECFVSEPAGPAADEAYFDDSVTAADRAYLAASRYRLGDMPARNPRDLPRVAPLIRGNPTGVDEVDLPVPAMPPTSLETALARRRSARGRCAGLTAQNLATVLWPALSPIADAPSIRWGERADDVWQRRPNPSAGAQYTVRTRLIVRHVDGVQPGLYDVVEARRRLARLAPAPGVDDLAAMSMWFSTRPPFRDRWDAGTVPAVLALWLDMANLRARYGLRALRFGLLEAGHVAQSLALAGAACGVASSTIGGFYDDVASEVLMLDGLDDVPVYLLPLGGAIGNCADSPQA